MILKKFSIIFFWFLAALLIQGQNISNRDPKILEMVSEVASANLEKSVRQLVSFGTRHSFSTNKDAGRGIEAACKWVKGEFDKISLQSEGRFEAVWDTFSIKPDGRRIKKQALMINVLGKLIGYDKNDTRIFIVSGHIDSRNGDANDTELNAPGANDDASGVALVIELARIMAKRKFPATIIFAVVSGEEQGLLGAAHIANMAKDSNWNIAAMLNNDMVGNSRSSGTDLSDNLKVRVFSEGVPAYETDEMKSMRQSLAGENDSKSRQLARYIKEVGERYVDNIEVKLIYRNDRFLRGGDHTPFSKNGFTAVRFCEMNENYDRQHQNVREEKGKKYGDLPEFVDFEYVRKIASINLAVLANANLAPLSPEKVYIDVRELSNDSKLKWNAPAGKIPAGYFVLLRETNLPYWQKKIFIKGNEVKLPYSKDNYFFAVQSVDEEGHESVPVFPVILR